MGKANTNIRIRYMYVPTGLAGMAVKTKQNRCRALRLGGRGEGGGLKEQVAKSGGWRRRRRVDVKQAVRLSDGKYR